MKASCGKVSYRPLVGAVAIALALVPALVWTQDARPKPPPAQLPSSYMKVDITEPFQVTMERMKAARPAIERRQQDLLAQRYDLANRPAAGVTMFRGKPVQAGVRVKLPRGVTWQQLAGMRPEDVKAKGLFPAGFLPLSHPNHPEGGMLFPQFHIDEILRQERRDLNRFDLSFDLPDHILPEFHASGNGRRGERQAADDR
ncbi:hypothetical protein [Pseudoduganella umbonata]|uniref:Cytochrome c peroxidase n=1 Tax=Pseudoduganella umbonata TaxID=864828 RepID=A0A7W5E7I5_9BURK|nr:hypothetical protein [Pseudoduganella umbonata]MBB3219690.1 cytochrome c peroxidase [Pseudoduganella umbonata]